MANTTAPMAPKDSECLPCYLSRMVADFGCAHRLRWVERWRLRRAPRATALARRLVGRGGTCDCKVLANVHPEYLSKRGGPEPPPCAGVRPGSTRPCGRGGEAMS